VRGWRARACARNKFAMRVEISSTTRQNCCAFHVRISENECGRLRVQPTIALREMIDDRL
jgi:hypothetical protein